MARPERLRLTFSKTLLGLGLPAEPLALETQRELRTTRYTDVETALGDEGRPRSPLHTVEDCAPSVAGLFLLAAVCVAFLHIRAGHVPEHREWMLRAIATALGIASVRIIALPLDLALAPRGVDPGVIFALSLWLGWGVTLSAAEWWIRTTRPSACQ